MLVSNIIAEVYKIVQVRPDVTYNPGIGGCKYADGICSDNTVGCLFGQALSNLGVDVKRFDKYPMPLNGEGTYTPAIDRILQNEFVGTEQELNWCAKVQEYQDNGCSWGEAIKEVDNTL
jgi:hypothetical protein